MWPRFGGQPQDASPFCVVKLWLEGHADVVAAINILERGLSLLACGGPVQQGRSVKQEPTQALQSALA